MSWIIKTILAAFFCLSMISITDAERVRYDGNWWIERDESQKSYFVGGFFTGIELGHRFSYGDSSDKGEREILDKISESYTENTDKYIRDITVGQVHEGLDDFYKDRRLFLCPHLLFFSFNETFQVDKKI